MSLSFEVFTRREGFNGDCLCQLIGLLIVTLLRVVFRYAEIDLLCCFGGFLSVTSGDKKIYLMVYIFRLEG